MTWFDKTCLFVRKSLKCEKVNGWPSFNKRKIEQREQIVPLVAILWDFESNPCTNIVNAMAVAARYPYAWPICAWSLMSWSKLFFCVVIAVGANIKKETGPTRRTSNAFGEVHSACKAHSNRPPLSTRYINRDDVCVMCILKVYCDNSATTEQFHFSQLISPPK
jgi:hypothetical protein